VPPLNVALLLKEKREIGQGRNWINAGDEGKNKKH